MTTASISPCLHVEPEKTPSPLFFVTGSDSPVSADCRELSKLKPKTTNKLHLDQSKTRLCYDKTHSEANFWETIVTKY